MDWLEQTTYIFGKHILKVLCYPILPDQRLFYLYLLSSFGFAVGVYVFSRTYREDKRTGRRFLKGLLNFVFPKKVWEHPSAWVDVRYFVPHQLLRLWIYTDFIAVFAIASNLAIVSALRAAMGKQMFSTFPADHFYLVILYTFVSLIALDFSAFFLHYCQHKFRHFSLNATISLGVYWLKRRKTRCQIVFKFKSLWWLSSQPR